jgi:hypothetical protein
MQAAAEETRRMFMCIFMPPDESFVKQQFTSPESGVAILSVVELFKSPQPHGP